MQIKLVFASKRTWLKSNLRNKVSDSQNFILSTLGAITDAERGFILLEITT